MAGRVAAVKQSSSKSIGTKSRTSKTTRKPPSKNSSKGTLSILENEVKPSNVVDVMETIVDEEVISKNIFNEISITNTVATNDRYYNIITPVRFKALQKQAEEAIQNGKTFLMRARWPIVRKTFLKRGWIELYERHYYPNSPGTSKMRYFDLVRHLPVRQTNETLPNYTARCERFVLSRLISHVSVSFTWSWVPNKTDFEHQLRHPEMIVNKLLVSPFVSKETLARTLHDNLAWLAKEGELTVNYPRSYSSSDPDQINEFLQNFRQTACIGFLKYIVEKSTKSNWKVFFDDNPSTEIPYSALEFAMQRCYELLNTFKHSDIDSVQGSLVTERDWDRFFEHHHLLTQKKGQIRKDKIQSVESILRNAEMLLENISPYWPEYSLDGHLNVWIVKPADDMCGKGIIISNNFKKIKDIISKPKPQKRYVLQKYIERPFTIYNTKFDIRQYFLVTNVYPLEIWMYNESYLRFSTKPYDLNDFHESVHITNNAVQRKYKVDPKRDSRLPRQNMWDCISFQAYLRQVGKGDAWESQIYPSIKQAIIGTVLASQPSMIQRNNTFQLYGADLILCEALNPWMIEVNGCPNLYLSTNVTSRIVPQCVEDLFKVIIDRRKDPKADTGNFELIYSQTLTPNKKRESKKLSVVAKPILNPTFQVRREMYQQLIQQQTRRSDPRALLPLNAAAKPIRKSSDSTSTSLRTQFISKPSTSTSNQENLGSIRNDLTTRIVRRGT